MTINETDFIPILQTTDFAVQYYSYCARFRSQLPFTINRPRQSDVMRCLKMIERPLQRSKVDGTYLIDLDGIRSGFAFQSAGALECIFSIQNSDHGFFGGSFAIIAAQVQTANGLPLPNPPYPRPDYTGRDGLADLLEGWDRLDKQLRAIGRDAR
jgi:hypothetical protein